MLLFVSDSHFISSHALHVLPLFMLQRDSVTQAVVNRGEMYLHIFTWKGSSIYSCIQTSSSARTASSWLTSSDGGARTSFCSAVPPLYNQLWMVRILSLHIQSPWTKTEWPWRELQLLGNLSLEFCSCSHASLVWRGWLHFRCQLSWVKVGAGLN